jgi:broad specificity phosphatase PhoE
MPTLVFRTASASALLLFFFTTNALMVGSWNRIAAASPAQRSTAVAFAAGKATTTAPSTQQQPRRNDQKVITFVRHGCTYMNEYLAGADGGKRFGAPSFTDIFHDNDNKRRLHKYKDSPLSPYGRRQSEKLSMSQRLDFVAQDCELVVVSPLTRALETFHLGLKMHVADHIPIIAVPEAAERLYLISDVGRSTTELQMNFPYVDFETGFHTKDKDAWWYQPPNRGHYIEWRPIGQGQRYACPGEPQCDFDQRMSRLHGWLENRPEQNIVVVCHHGVIEWMLDLDFDNCEHQQIRFADIQPAALQPQR